jgi:hypothetical protein
MNYIQTISALLISPLPVWSGYAEKPEIREKQWEDEKRQEIQQPKEILLIQQDNRLASIEARILEKGTLIEELTHLSIYLQTSEELISIREKIQTLKAELNDLWHEQWIIEREIEQEDIGIGVWSPHDRKRTLSENLVSIKNSLIYLCFSKLIKIALAR